MGDGDGGVDGPEDWDSGDGRLDSRNDDGFDDDLFSILGEPGAGIHKPGDQPLASIADETKPIRNQAPVVSDLRLRVRQGARRILDLLENASDPDGDALSVRILTQPRHGKLIANADGTFTYVPDPGYLGEDRFTYRVNDGRLDSNTATVTLVVVLAEERNGKDQGERPGKSASITFHSALGKSPAPEPERYIILRGTKGEAKGEAPQKPKIDWNGIPPVIAVAPLWIPAFLKKDEDEELTPQRLAEITGLRFPMDQEKE
jgi:hypothetical protein